MPVHPARYGRCLNLDADEVASMWHVIQSLNTTIAQAVEFTREHYDIPVYFADNIENMAQPGHHMCGPKVCSYFVPITELGGATRIAMDALASPKSSQELVHPNAKGHQKWAQDLSVWSAGKYNITTGTGTVEDPSRLSHKLWRGWRHLPPVFYGEGGRTYDLYPVEGSSPFVEKTQKKSLTPGQTLVLQSSKLAPLAFRTALIRSEPTILGSTIADGNGNLTIKTTVPDTITVGQHHIEIWSRNAEGETVAVAIPVTVHAPIPLPNALVALLTAISFVLAIPLLIISLRRRRSKRQRVRLSQ